MADKGPQAKALAESLRESGENEEALVAIYNLLWPADETPAEYENLIGAENGE